MRPQMELKPKTKLMVKQLTNGLFYEIKHGFLIVIGSNLHEFITIGIYDIEK